MPAARTLQCPRCGVMLSTDNPVCPTDGPVFVDVAELHAALKADYDILGTLGAGGMSIIYKARNRRTNEIVAIKMLPSHMATEVAVERFVVEAKAINMLSNRFIIKMHDIGLTASGQPYIVHGLHQGHDDGRSTGA